MTCLGRSSRRKRNGQQGSLGPRTSRSRSRHSQRSTQRTRPSKNTLPEYREEPRSYRYDRPEPSPNHIASARDERLRQRQRQAATDRRGGSHSQENRRQYPHAGDNRKGQGSRQPFQEQQYQPLYLSIGSREDASASQATFPPSELSASPALRQATPLRQFPPVTEDDAILRLVSELSSDGLEESTQREPIVRRPVPKPQTGGQHTGPGRRGQNTNQHSSQTTIKGATSPDIPPFSVLKNQVYENFHYQQQYHSPQRQSPNGMMLQNDHVESTEKLTSNMVDSLLYTGRPPSSRLGADVGEQNASHMGKPESDSTSTNNHSTPQQGQVDRKSISGDAPSESVAESQKTDRADVQSNADQSQECGSQAEVVETGRTEPDSPEDGSQSNDGAQKRSLWQTFVQSISPSPEGMTRLRKSVIPSRSSSKQGTFPHPQYTATDPHTQLAEYLEGVQRRIRLFMFRQGIKEHSSASWLEAFMSWVPVKLEAQKDQIHGLAEASKAWEAAFEQEKQRMATLERDRDHWYNQFLKASEAVQILRSSLEQEKIQVSQARQKLDAIQLKHKELEEALKQVQSTNLYLDQDLKNERDKTWRLDEQLQQQNIEHQRVVAQWSHALTQEQQAREQDRQAHEGRLQEEKQTHERQLQEEKQTHERQLEEERRVHKHQVATVTTNFQEQIAQDAKKSNQKLLKQKQIIASHVAENYSPIGDDALQHKFQTLAQTIRNLIGYFPQSDQRGPEEISHSNGHHGTKAWPKIFRNKCWELLFKGFFKDQPGFGALGHHGEGYEVLNGLRELFFPDTHGFQDQQEGSDRDKNAWRASLFASLLQEVREASPSASKKKLPALFHKNVEIVAEDLVRTLHRISGGNLDSRARPRLQTLAHDMGVLALELGSQRARIVLNIAHQGEKMSCGPGARFKDESGDGGRGAGGEVTVDFTTQPCLRKIGDGRNDTQSENVLVRGEIVAYED